MRKPACTSEKITPVKGVHPDGITKAKGGGRKADVDYSGNSLLACTEKGVNSALKIMDRVVACHGRHVGDVVNMLVNGERYKIADLKYDLKHGRLEVVPNGKAVGPVPKGKARSKAPKAGQPMPAATVDEFFRFLQCQLRKEVLEHTGKDLTLKDEGANAIWPEVQQFVDPNLGKTERWVPYHTILGVHELFLAEHVHSHPAFDERKKFISMFVFRAHCKRDLFSKVQLPMMLKDSFWKSPAKAFETDGPMEKAILQYRQKTGEPLITSCFRIIPERVLKDDDANLVRSIVTRSQNLIRVAERAFPVVKDAKKGPQDKLLEISKIMAEYKGLGDTWVKMLTVCVDLAYPKMRLLETECEVGVGAAAPLKALLPDGQKAKAENKDNKQALRALLKVVNSAKGDASKRYWEVLAAAESDIGRKYKHLSLVREQVNTKKGALCASTLQVQLCEFRQFRHSVARNTYGLPDDETMRCEPDTGESRVRPEDMCTVGDGKVTFRREGVDFEVRIDQCGDNEMVAKRVASLCFQLLREGGSKEEAAAFRKKIIGEYVGGQESPADSESWRHCRLPYTAIKNQAAQAISFQMVLKDGTRFPFQTTTGAAGGVLNGERVARLCWDKLNGGTPKEKVLEYRKRLYEEIHGEAKQTPQPKRSKKS